MKGIFVARNDIISPMLGSNEDGVYLLHSACEHTSSTTSQPDLADSVSAPNRSSSTSMLPRPLCLIRSSSTKCLCNFGLLETRWWSEGAKSICLQTCIQPQRRPSVRPNS